jgi:hypothetical protein
MAALAGIFSGGFGEGGYLPDHLQNVLAQGAAALDVPFELSSPDSQTGQTILGGWDTIVGFLLSACSGHA